jgi:hypothetical protein
MLLRIYSNINEPDTIYGINKLYQKNSYIIRYEHENNYQKAFQSYDILLNNKNNNKNDSIKFENGILKSLKNIGIKNVFDVFMEKHVNNNNSSDFIELYYENNWKKLNFGDNEEINEIEKFNEIEKINEIEKFNSKNFIFNKNVYKMLKFLKSNEIESFNNIYYQTKIDILKNINQGNINKELSNFRVISTIKEYIEIKKLKNSDIEIKKNFENIYKYNKDLSFNTLEPLYSIQNILLLLNNDKELINENLYNYSKFLRKNNFVEKAFSEIYSKRIIDNDINPKLLLEESKLLKLRKEENSSLSISKYIINIENLSKDIMGETLLFLGNIFFNLIIIH